MLGPGELLMPGVGIIIFSLEQMEKYQIELKSHQASLLVDAPKVLLILIWN
jgi:hypothetical protein